MKIRHILVFNFVVVLFVQVMYSQWIEHGKYKESNFNINTDNLVFINDSILKDVRIDENNNQLVQKMFNINTGEILPDSIIKYQGLIPQNSFLLCSKEDAGVFSLIITDSLVNQDIGEANNVYYINYENSIQMDSAKLFDKLKYDKILAVDNY